MNPASFIGSKQSLAAVVAGMVLAVCGLMGYILDPSTAFQAVFVAGVVLLAAGYILLYLGNRSACAEESEMMEKEDREGFFYIMDEDYSAPAGDATITDLTKE